MTKRLKTKTVFVIGAGFSVEAKAPSQDKLVKKIFEVHKVNSSVFKENKIKEFTDFLSETLCIPRRSVSAFLLNRSSDHSVRRYLYSTR